jgi:hypothetical protein
MAEDNSAVGLASATQIDQSQQYQKTLFPFSAFTQDDPNTTDNPVLTLDDAWAMAMKTLTVDDKDTIGAGIIAKDVVTGQGSYVVYGNGYAECWFFDTTLKTTNAANGSVFYNATKKTWTFPVSFIEAPFVEPSAKTVQYMTWGHYSGLTAASVDLYLDGSAAIAQGYIGAKACGFVNPEDYI